MAGDEVFDFGEELGGIAEAAVDGGVAEEGDFVEVFEFVEDFASDDHGGDFALVFGFDFAGDVVDHDVELGIGDGALDDGIGDGLAEFAGVVVFVASVSFLDDEGVFDKLFIGGVAVAALGADAAAADDFVVSDGTGVDDFIGGLLAFGATHGDSVRGAGRVVKRGVRGFGDLSKRGPGDASRLIFAVEMVIMVAWMNVTTKG